VTAYRPTTATTYTEKETHSSKMNRQPDIEPPA